METAKSHEFGIYYLENYVFATPSEGENPIPFPVLIYVPTCTAYLVPIIALHSRYILPKKPGQMWRLYLYLNYKIKIAPHAYFG